MSNEQKKHHAALSLSCINIRGYIYGGSFKKINVFIVTNTLIKQIRKSEISKYRVFSTLCFMFHIL